METGSKNMPLLQPDAGSNTRIGGLPPSIKKNDAQAKWLIGIFSFVVFAAVVALGKFKIPAPAGFDVHVFAKANAVINSMVTVLLVAGLIAVRSRRYLLHKRIMSGALLLSVIFLISYICHHLFSGDTRYGGSGIIRYVYFVILITHIILAATILPFILYTAYRALTGEWPRHVKLAKITWPVWLYVSVTGVIVYLMISPYY